MEGSRFGTAGDALYSALESNYSMLLHKLKRGEINEEEAFRQMSEIVLARYEECEKKRGKLKKRLLVSAGILLFFMLAGLSQDGYIGWVVFGSIPLAWTLWMHRTYGKEIWALNCFVDEHLEGKAR